MDELEKEIGPIFHAFALGTGDETLIDTKTGNFIEADSNHIVAAFAAAYRKGLVESLTNRRHECEWAVLLAKREGRNVEIEWQIKPGAGAPERFYVLGLGCTIEFTPSARDLHLEQIYAGTGSAAISLLAPEGVFKSFHLLFVNRDLLAAGQADKALRSISFELSVPASSPKASASQGAAGKGAPEQLHDRISSFLDTHDVLDLLEKNAAARIKAKNLPPEKERDRLADLADYIVEERSRLGL